MRWNMVGASGRRRVVAAGAGSDMRWPRQGDREGFGNEEDSEAATCDRAWKAYAIMAVGIPRPSHVPW